LLPFLSLGVFFVAPTNVANADVVSAAAMLQRHNELRFAVGAPTLTADPRIVTAAQNHANYNSANRIVGHFETAGLPYYTGYAPRDRVLAAGLNATFVSEVATSFGGALNGVQQLWDAPYHRLGLMHPSASSAGWGHADLVGSATVADITYDFGINVGSVMVTNEWNFSTGSTISGGGTTAVAPTDNGLHSAWVSQTPTGAMQAAATTTVTLSFRNTGTKTWTKGVAGSQVTLAINGDSAAYSNMGMNVGWPSANRVAVQNEAVIGPGGTATFTFTTRAPFAAGTVSLPLRLVVDGVAWLEDQGVFVPITTIVDYHSRWASQSAYPTLRAGQVSGSLT